MAQITNNPTLLHQIDAGLKGRKKVILTKMNWHPKLTQHLCLIQSQTTPKKLYTKVLL